GAGIDPVTLKAATQEEMRAERRKRDDASVESVRAQCARPLRKLAKKAAKKAAAKKTAKKSKAA
ncbi:MAG: hypothetical protein WCP45_13515, partial [Verrucomicrobiota bacterium]